MKWGWSWRFPFLLLPEQGNQQQEGEPPMNDQPESPISFQRPFSEQEKQLYAALESIVLPIDDRQIPRSHIVTALRHFADVIELELE